MTPSVREAAYQALLAALRAGLPMEVARNRPAPFEVEEPCCGLTDGEAELVDETLGVRRYAFADPARLELYLQTHLDDRRERFVDEWVGMVETALADRTLGRAVDWLEISPPGKSVEGVDDAVPLAAATLTITLHYCSTRASG
jgi:hypothetical protein